MADFRRMKIVRLLHVKGGLALRKDGWPDGRIGALGNQAALARQLGVSRSTICPDMAKLLRETYPCLTCGAGVRPPGPKAAERDDDCGCMEDILAGVEEGVAAGRLRWAGRGPLPRPEAQQEGPPPVEGQGR